MANDWRCHLGLDCSLYSKSNLKVQTHKTFIFTVLDQFSFDARETYVVM